MDLLDVLGILGFLVIALIFLGSALQSIPCFVIGSIFALIGCLIGIGISEGA